MKTSRLSILFRQCLIAEKFNPVWFTEKQCLEIKQKEKNSIFIFEDFLGDAFVHLSNLKFRILGPQCILTSTACKKEIPRGLTPIFNLAMKDLLVCCTSVDIHCRDEIYQKVRWMGGNVTKDFMMGVTHLVAGEVGSKKYQVAADLGLPIMLPTWVNTVWETSRKEAKHIHALDEQFQGLKCPIFYGLVVTVSGLSSDERKEAKKLIEKEGGTYSGEMKMNHTTHLIINEAKGQKYEFAKKWNMCIIKTEWLYDSVEKGYCQKAENYPVDSREPGHQSVKTSTPERASLTGKEIGDISNISAISMMQINETRCNDNTFSSSSTSMNYHDPFKGLDVASVPEGDFFLDSCKIYLSGFQGQAMDKLRKIINAGGATRFSQINENLTHAVIGEKISKDIELLKHLSTRPHAVTVQWLIDCFKQRKHLSEIDYVSPEFPPLNPTSPKLKRDTHLSKPRLNSKGASSDGETNKGHSLKVEEKQEIEEEEEAEMEDIMSQYLVQPKLTAESGEVTAVENKSAIHAGQVQVQVMEEDMTQDPEQTIEPDGDESSKGIFNKKTFVIYGFEDEAMAELAVFIVDNAGVVVHQNFRPIPDYAVVPIDGFPVERTVKDVVTNAWLQMCIERDMLLPVDGNPLFQPIEFNIDGNPLADCVLSISGIAGVERDCLVHIAELLGATCQEYFVRVARSNFKASTHLIVNAPEGSKFEAAKKWNIPAVSRDWLFACAKSGINEPEENYLIENVLQNNDQCMDQSEPSKQTDNQSKGRSKSLSNEEANVSVNKLEEDSASKENVNQQETILNQEMDDFTTNEDALLAEIKLDNFSVDTNASVDRTKMNNLSVHEVDKKNKDQENVKNRSAIKELPSDFANHKDQSVSSEIRNSCEAMSSTSQKENRTVVKNLKESTPLHNRIKELQVREADRKPRSPATQALLGIVTPSKFLDPNKPYKPDFDVNDFLKAIETPPEVKAKMSSRRKFSEPLGELIERHLDIMVERSEQMTRQMSQSQMDEVDGSMPHIDKPLKGVVISVSKKLCSKQAEYNDIVSELGGDYMWTYGSTCTHFIFQGKTNDTSKEFKVAKEHKKIIVSPFWLQMCKEQNARVDESLFPHNYNPNLSLSVVKKLETPKSTRRTARLARVERVDNHDTKGDHSTENKESKKAEKPIIESEKVSALAANQVTENSKAGGDAAASENETKGSYEMREVLSRQLENIMAASKGTNSGSKRRMKRTNSSGQFNISGETPGSTENRPSSRQIRRTQEDTPKSSKRQIRSTGHMSDSNPDTMPSQSLQVVWDDPIGRLEKEKLAHKLQRACSPTQEVDSLAEALDIPPDAQYSDGEQDMDTTIPQFGEHGNGETNGQKDEPHRTPTPEAPSLDFPMPKTHKEVTPPKPVEPMKEEKKKSKAPPVFLFSGISPEERTAYGALIEQIGGKVLDCVNFDPICTHLIVGTPARNEKFLACVASGKWVLHKSYLEACREQNTFIQEDLFEWGGEGTMSLLSDQNSKEAKLAKAAHHWRIKIQEARQIMSKSYGAFQNWKVILCLGNGKEANFRRLLEAGGATVFNKRPPFTKDIDATHVFLELATANLSQMDLEHLAASAAICVRPEFIPAQLMDIQAPDPTEYCPSQILVLRKNIQTEKPPGRKRRNTPASDESGKLKRTRQR
ncbi:hypothetical protein ACJMK2_021298 [Sinanodonta woodiana]|uniref:BRCT domain-containing protein n=1 Tax=Sinanodonta woodiana TaxID=1069815 RepID=A0ABD3THK1_SINWO